LVHFDLDHFLQDKAKTFFTQEELSNNLKSALGQTFKYTSANYSANCQVHLSQTIAPYLRRLVRTHMGKDENLVREFVKAFIQDEEEEEAEEQYERQDNIQDKDNGTSDKQQQKQKLQEKLQEMQQQMKNIIPEGYQYVLSG
jgi:hypothetical protein